MSTRYLRTAVGGILLLAAPAVAQSYLYSPLLAESFEGRGFATHFGAHPDMRLQMVDGDHRGKAVRLDQLAFRLDDRSYYPAIGGGRTFANVELHMAHGDHDGFGANFANNLKSTPTQVFRGTVRWPSASGFPLLSPARWGGLRDEYQFPFRAPWSTDATKDIVADVRFAGGTLHSGAVWIGAKPYYFDSYGPTVTKADGTYRYIPAKRLGNNSAGISGRCNDSAFGNIPTGSTSDIFAAAYGPTHSRVEWRNKLVVYSTSRYTAFSSPVIHSWGLVTNEIGLNFGTGCNRLHTVGPQVTFSFMTQPRSVDPTAFSGFKYNIIPWIHGLSSLRLCMQAGWADSATRKLNLTQAREVTLPPGLPKGIVVKRKALMQHGSTKVGPTHDHEYNPALRYRH